MSRIMREALANEAKRDISFTLEDELSLVEQEMNLKETSHELKLQEITLEELNTAFDNLIGLEESMSNSLEESKENVSLEGYKEAYTSITSLEGSELSLESIGDVLKRIWEAIMNAIKKTISYVKKIFTSLFSASEKVERENQAISEKLKDVPPEHPEGTPKVLEIPERTATRIVYNDSLEYKDILEGANAVLELSKVHERGGSELKIMAMNWMDEVENVLDDIKSSGDDLNIIATKINGLTKTHKHYLEEAESHYRDLKGRILPGNMIFNIFEEDSNGELPTKVGPDIVPVTNNPKLPELEIDLPPTDKLGILSDKIDEILTNVTSSESTADKFHERYEQHHAFLRRTERTILETLTRFDDRDFGDALIRKLRITLNIDYATPIGRMAEYLVMYSRQLLSFTRIATSLHYR